MGGEPVSTPDDISNLPLTKAEISLGLKTYLDGVIGFFHQYRKVLPWEEIPELEALEGAAQDVDYALEWDEDEEG